MHPILHEIMCIWVLSSHKEKSVKKYRHSTYSLVYKLQFAMCISEVFTLYIWFYIYRTHHYLGKFIWFLLSFPNCLAYGSTVQKISISVKCRTCLLKAWQTYITFSREVSAINTTGSKTPSQSLHSRIHDNYFTWHYI